MTEKILVPVLGESITEATISKWLKSKGDNINVDEPIVELETDKVNLEVPSPINGTLTEVNFKDGDTVEVGAILGEISSALGDQKKEDIENNEKPQKKTSDNIINFGKEKTQKPKIFEDEEKEEPLVLTKEEPLVLTQELPSSKKAINKKTGARGLRSILEVVLLSTMYELPSQANLAEVIIEKNAITGQGKPIMVHSKNKDKTDTTSAA
jgi:pyruvate/2-oxoglutarate dehydrogenase complex dihydrolipoamide acyltransferase (E2) component